MTGPRGEGLDLPEEMAPQGIHSVELAERGGQGLDAIGVGLGCW